MSFTQDLFTSRRNYNDGSTRVGQVGRIWYDSETRSFRVGDGVTAGGSIISGVDIAVAGIGLSSVKTGNLQTITSNATHQNIPNTIVARDSTGFSNIGELWVSNVTIAGNLLVLGRATYIDYSALSIVDRFVTLSNIANPSDIAADGGGIILKGTTNHTLLWDRNTQSWDSTENINLQAGRAYRINDVDVVTGNSILDSISNANLAVAATTITIAAITGNTRIRNNLVVDGNLTVNGSFPVNLNYDYLNLTTGLGNPAYSEGRLFYDDTAKTLAIYSDITNHVQHVGQEVGMRVINLSNETIFTGNAVYIVGASGDKPRIAKARADSIAACQVAGIAATDMTHGSIGFVTVSGVIHNVDTAGMTAGSPVYLSTTVPGAFSTQHPEHPFYDVHLGYVLRENKNNGVIEVLIRNVAFDRLMIAGNANFEANVVVDKNIVVIGNSTIGGTASVTGLSTLASARVSNLTAGRVVLAASLGQLSDSSSFVYNTTTNTLTTQHAVLGGTLSVIGAASFTSNITSGPALLHSANIQNAVQVGGTLSVTAATTLASSLSAGTSTLSALTVSGTVAVIGTSTFTGDITAGNIDSTSLDTTGVVNVGGALTSAGNFTVNTNRFFVDASTGDTNVAGILTAFGKAVIAGGNLDVTTNTFHIAPTATDLRLGQNFGTTKVRNSLDVDGDLNIDGGYVTAGTAAINLFNTSTIVNAFTNATTLNMGSASGTGTTTINNDLFLVGNLTVNGTQVTYNSAVATVQDPVLLLGGAPPAVNDDNKDRGIQFSWHTGTASRVGFFGWDDSEQAFTVIPNANNIGEIFFGSPGDIKVGAISATTGVFSAQVDISSSLAVNGTGLTTTSGTFGLLNSTATTVNFAGSATSINIGASTGITNIRHNLDVDLDINIDGGDLTTSAITFNLLPTSALYVNFATAATNLVIGATSGTTQIRNNLDIDNDLNIDGNDLTTSSGAFNLLNTNAAVVNAFGAASVINLGSSSGLTTVRNTLDIDGTVNIDGGSLTTNSNSFNLLNLNALNVNAFASATVLQLGGNSGSTTIRNKLNLNNDLDVLGSVNIDQNIVVDGSASIDGFLDVDNSADILNNLNVGGSVTIVGGLTVGAAGFNSTSLSFALLNTYTTTINAFGSATVVEIGNLAGGKTTVNHDLEVKGSNITTNKTTVNLLNATATTVNFAGASTSLNLAAATGTTTINNSLDVKGSLTVSGITASVAGSTFNFAPTIATTVNFAGAATTLTLGSTSGSTNVQNNLAVAGNVSITGDLTVNGTVTTINSTTISVDDKNIELGSVTTPTDITADGGGITLRGTTQKTLNWINSTAAWTSSEHLDIATGKEYRINNSSVLTSTTLGATVVNSSLTTLGTIGTGQWQATVIAPAYGGTGVNNGGRTITLGGNFSTAGNFNLSLVLTAGTSVTLPTTGTLSTLAGAETISNKTFNLANNTLTGTLAEFNSALAGADFATVAGAETLTNKTISLTNNTVSGTLAEFNSALIGADFASVAGSENLTNKTYNGLTVTTSTGTLTVANSKTLTVSNSLTLTGTDSSSVAFGGGGTVAYTANKLNVFAATSSSELAGIISDETGTGALVFANSPTLVTPTLGAASATSVSISSVITLAPLSSAPASPSAGMIAVADNAGGGWDPAGVGSGTPYPVFYDGTNWVKMTP